MKIVAISAVSFLLAMLCISCRTKSTVNASAVEKKLPDQFIVVLGIAQDAGYPQIGCEKECCKEYWNGTEKKKFTTCLALVDRSTEQYWLFEATPDIKEQLHNLQPYLFNKPDYLPDGIFITHAHIGHYSGLMQFGKEAMGAANIPVWAMPRLDSFFTNNGPWSQLVSQHNINLQSLKADSSVSISLAIKITPIKVPHRDEYSETVGFVIETNKKKVLFIPDIDKWEKWDRDIIEQINKVDMALLDGTFYKNGELPGRDMREVPHPFVEESMQRFSSLPSDIKSKVTFIHFNHTNPLLKNESVEKQAVTKQGFHVAAENEVIAL